MSVGKQPSTACAPCPFSCLHAWQCIIRLSRPDWHCSLAYPYALAALKRGWFLTASLLCPSSGWLSGATLSSVQPAHSARLAACRLLQRMRAKPEELILFFFRVCTSCIVVQVHLPSQPTLVQGRLAVRLGHALHCGLGVAPSLLPLKVPRKTTVRCAQHNEWRRTLCAGCTEVLLWLHSPPALAQGRLAVRLAMHFCAACAQVLICMPASGVQNLTALGKTSTDCALLCWAIVHCNCALLH